MPTTTKEIVMAETNEAARRKFGLTFAIAFTRAYCSIFGSCKCCQYLTVERCFYALTPAVTHYFDDAARGELYLRVESAYSVSETEINELTGPIMGWIIAHETEKVARAINALKKRSVLPGFEKKYPGLKQMLMILTAKERML